ncbi:MAG TPA: winged helix-turn-helix domain-containing protein [Streptosporangiaceae bacterium]|jgi:hypothetical protein
MALTHPLRAALLDLVREHGTLTSTEAARLLGESSGLCSFHLRQLARYGYLVEAARPRGRMRPWRLAAAVLPNQPANQPAGQPADDGFGALARDLEDEGYRRWLAGRSQAPLPWQHDEVFSAVLDLSPAELAEAAAEIRAVLGRYQGRAGSGRRPVAAVIRLFPLLPAGPDS